MDEPGLERPSDAEVEVSLIGPGYGECVVIHLGGNRWMVVDSCLDKESGRPAAVIHLEKMGVNPAEHVDLVVCTHWHDDHVRGLAALLSQCPSARFICSTSLRESAFLRLVALGENVRGLHGSGLSEFARIFQRIKTRREQNKPAPLETCHAGSVLLDREEMGQTIRVDALSPSEGDHQRMAEIFKDHHDHLLAADFRIAVPSIHPNLGSIVLRVQAGRRRVLLGADMERRPSSDSGWLAILESSKEENRSDYYKVAHHGSENGDTPEIWSRLLVPECPAVLAPNQRLANPLPRKTDISRILSRTSVAYSTALPSLRAKRIEAPAEGVFRSKGIRIHEVPRCQGTVIARANMNGSEPWGITTLGRAYRLVEAV